MKYLMWVCEHLGFVVLVAFFVAFLCFVRWTA